MKLLQFVNYFFQLLKFSQTYLRYISSTIISAKILHMPQSTVFTCIIIIRFISFIVYVAFSLFSELFVEFTYFQKNLIFDTYCVCCYEVSTAYFSNFVRCYFISQHRLPWFFVTIFYFSYSKYLQFCSNFYCIFTIFLLM